MDLPQKRSALFILLFTIVGTLALLQETGSLLPNSALSAAGLAIVDVSSNSNSVPVYDKFELTFNITNTVATNLQFPYDVAPPPGLDGRSGISVDALFLPPGETDWRQALIQPGFVYQDYQRQLVNNSEWLYPQGVPVWKIRFAPTEQGIWQYKISVQDNSGSITSNILSFTALPRRTANPGFVTISKSDDQYFALSDGRPFLGVGHNTGFSTSRFTYDADEQFARYTANGVDFLRVWMSGSTIAGSSWSPWDWFGGPYYAGYLPDPGLWIAPPGAGTDYTFDLTQQYNRPCIFNGFTQGRIAVKPGTTYRFSAMAKVENLSGPKDANDPNFGFVVKTGPWPQNNICPDGVDSYPVITPYFQNTDWTTVEGSVISRNDQWFLDYLYLVLDNTTAGDVHITQMSLQEELPGGGLGPNLLMKSNADSHMDFNQLRSWDWDYALDRAADNGVYMKIVVLDKNDRVWDFINSDGTLSSNGGNDNFYAADNTKVRRLQEYYWRYLAARWGYSTAVQSWELLNEGDPYNGRHYDQTDKFALFMHTWDRNHLVTTSFWHSYPEQEFWGNPSYPNPDYADIHAYADTGTVNTDTHDDAGLYLAYSQYVRNFNLSKPTVRGETGLSCSPGTECADLTRDQYGVWLHNLTWARLDSPMYDLYWWTNNIVEKNLYFQYKAFRDFMTGVAFDNGKYHPITASISNSNVRAVGQMDSTYGRAHIWIQNKLHTWWNVVNSVPWGRLTGTVTLSGFAPNHSYPVEFWQFDDQGTLTKQYGTIAANSSGEAVIDLASLPGEVTDVAVKIGDYEIHKCYLEPILK